MSHKGPSGWPVPVTLPTDRSSTPTPATTSPGHRGGSPSKLAAPPYGSSSPTDPAPPCGRAWQKFYALATRSHKRSLGIPSGSTAGPPLVHNHRRCRPQPVDQTCGKSCGGRSAGRVLRERFAEESPPSSGSGASPTATGPSSTERTGWFHRLGKVLWNSDLSSPAGSRRPGQSRTTASRAAATSSSRRSAPWAATSWTPTGRPSGAAPAGRERAGQPVTVTRYAERIQSR